jgi:hypothetical protein
MVHVTARGKPIINRLLRGLRSLTYRLVGLIDAGFLGRIGLRNTLRSPFVVTSEDSASWQARVTTSPPTSSSYPGSSRPTSSGSSGADAACRNSPSSHSGLSGRLVGTDIYRPSIKWARDTIGAPRPDVLLHSCRHHEGCILAKKEVVSGAMIGVGRGDGLRLDRREEPVHPSASG